MTRAADVVLRYLATQRDVLAGREQDVRNDGPDAVHRSRVATRRSRSLLRTYGRLFDQDATVGLRSDLAWHADHLGAPRDTEVLLERLLASLERLPSSERLGPVKDRLTAELGRSHDSAHASLVASMDEPRYADLRESLDKFLAQPPLRGRAKRPAETVLPALFDRAVDRVRGLVDRAEDLPSDLTHWHEVRKAAKAARYCAEALQAEFPIAEELAEAWEAVTEGLGEVQDSVVAEGVLVRLTDAARRADEPVEPYLAMQSAELAACDAALQRGRAALIQALDRSAQWAAVRGSSGSS